MARTLSNQQVYLPTGNPDTTNSATLYAPGELGAVFDFNPGKNQITYQRDKLDSGATAATPTGAVAANQLAFWKDKANKVVTNDQRFAEGNAVANASRNMVAGIFRSAITAGNYCDVLVSGNGISVASDGSGGAGQSAIADGTSATARVTPVAVGTAPTYQKIGVMAAAPGGGNVSVDVDLINLD